MISLNPAETDVAAEREMPDLYVHEITTLHGEPQRLTAWFEMAKQLAEEYSA